MSLKTRPSICLVGGGGGGGGGVLHQGGSGSIADPIKQLKNEMSKQYYSRLIHNRAKLRVTSRTSALLTGEDFIQ